MKAMVMNSPGAAEVLELVDRPDPVMGPADALIEVGAAGVNFMDIGVRRGLAWSETPDPKILGAEGAGKVIDVGRDVKDIRPGDRVAWVYAPGSYAQRIVVPTASLVPLPDEIDERTAASIMMQGLTASHFATDFYPVQRGDVALVHAAAGGLGLLLTQIIRLRGGSVIGRVSSETKAAIARQAGAENVIVDNRGKFAAEVARLTDGRGVDVVYDGCGAITFADSLASLRRCGTFCWYGPVLGGRTPIELMSLPASIKIGYAVFMDHIPTTELLRSRSRRLFDWVIGGQLKVRAGKHYALSDASQAHRDMESRASTGKLLLIP